MPEAPRDAAAPAPAATPAPAPPPPALALAGASVWVADGPVLLHPLDWTVAAGEHWLVLGGNGAGKTTLLSLAAAARRPSAGTVDVAGRRLGRVDLRDLRAVLGHVDSRLPERFPPRLTGRDVVLTGATGTTERLPARERPADAERADAVMDLLGCRALAGRRFATCSSGERQRLLLARALVPRPRLLLLDEPTTGLDFVAREALLGALAALAAAEPALATVLVTHHLEDVPASTTHALLLRGGRAVRSGPVAEVLTGDAVSACYDVPVEVSRWHGRWHAVAVPPGPPRVPPAPPAPPAVPPAPRPREDVPMDETTQDASGSTIAVRDEPDAGRWAAWDGDTLAGVAAYTTRDGVVVLTHTEVEPAYEGQGVGAALARAALGAVRERGLRVVLRCSYMAGYVERHPEYADLVAD